MLNFQECVLVRIVLTLKFWNNLVVQGLIYKKKTSAVAPIVPDLVSETDTSMFDEIEPKTQEEQQFPPPKTFSGDHLPFVGFTYTSDNMFVFS